jgi:integrase
MAAEIRKHTARGRSPWYTLYIDGEDVHLGTDYAKAIARAGELQAGRKPAAGETVPGLVKAYVLAGYPQWKVQHLGAWGRKMLLTDLTSLDGYAKALIKVWKFKPASVRDYIRHAQACIQWGIDHGWTATVPPTPDKLPKRVRSPRDIDPTVLRAALETLGRAKPIVQFIAATGCRPSEACNLEWSAVSMRTGTAMVNAHKTKHHGKTRTIYLSPAALAILAEIPTKEGPVFLSRFKRPYTPSGLRCILKRRGIPGAYCLRHTAAQAWLDDGVDFGVVAGLLGHHDLRTVQVYAQVRDPRLRRAAQGLRSPLE